MQPCLVWLSEDSYNVENSEKNEIYLHLCIYKTGTGRWKNKAKYILKTEEEATQLTK